MATKKIKSVVIKSGTIMNIEVSAEYYYRVYDLMTRLLERQPNAKEALINIDTPGKELSISEAVIQTFMMMIKSCEEFADKNKTDYTEEVEVDIEVDDDTTVDPS
jgi:hypothetical protein